MKFTTWIFAYVCQGLHFISTAVITANEARRQEDHIHNNTEDPIIRPFLPTSLSFIEQPFINQTEAEFCDPSTSIQCPPASSETRPVKKVLRYKSGTFNMNPGVPTDSCGVPVIVEASAPLHPSPRTPTLQQMFRN